MNRTAQLPITIRAAYADDESSLRRLAILDSAPVPAGPLLVAEVEGELRAALAIDGGAVIADPFHPTAGLVDLLRRHSALRTARRRGRVFSLRPYRADRAVGPARA